MHPKMLPAICDPFCINLNVLKSIKLHVVFSTLLNWGDPLSQFDSYGNQTREEQGGVSYFFCHRINTCTQTEMLPCWDLLHWLKLIRLFAKWWPCCLDFNVLTSGQTILPNDRSDRSKPLWSIIDRKANLRSIICRFFIIVKWSGLLLWKQYIIITVRLGIWDNPHLL